MSYPAISLATATAGRHRCPQKRLQTARQPPVYPNSSPDHRACNSLTPFRCPHAVHRWIRAKEAAEGRAGKGKPVRHQLHRTPTATQQARWEAVQQAREQGLSLRAIAKNLGMARDTVGKYLKAESPPTKKLSAKERAKAEALAASLIVADKSG